MAKGQPIRVLLVRGGATDWDEAGRLQGGCDLPMSAGGREHVRSICESLKDGGLTAVYTAPDEASVETATIVADRAGIKAVPVEDFREMNLGLWEGLSEADLAARFPRAARQWMDDPGAIAPPEGETFCVAKDRVVAAVKKVLSKAKPGSAICLVLRPIAMGTVRCWLGGESTCRLWTHVEECPGMEWRLYGGEQPAAKAAPRVATPAAAANLGVVRAARAI